MKNKIGLILSHIFVREGEHHKWEWVERSIDRHRELYDNFYIVLSGHGEQVPSRIENKVDVYYWEHEIREQDIGQGHPHFCIEGYEACIRAGCEYTLKNRAFDWLEHELSISEDMLFCSTNTRLDQEELGDLLMFGKTQKMLDLWSCLPWDYSLRDGTQNLYKNMRHIWGNRQLIEGVKFYSSTELGWKTIYDFKGHGPRYWGM
jgi:hypothetical protein